MNKLNDKNINYDKNVSNIDYSPLWIKSSSTIVQLTLNDGYIFFVKNQE